MEVEGDRLVIVEQLLRIWHDPNSTVNDVDGHALLTGLDADQCKAVTAESQLVAVVAGAGSGKTRVLTRRVAYRVADGTADEAHTLVLTFTREAAGELRRRLPALGIAGRVTAGTFHGIAHELLQQRWRDLDQRPRTITSDRRRLITAIAPSGVDVELLDAELSWATARRLTPATYDAFARHNGRRVLDPGTVSVALDAYRRHKHTLGVIDLDDLLTLTIDELERDAAYAEAQRWRFRHLLVDEAQDLNPLQHRLLDLLRDGRDDLFLVGDPAQAIYGFNGSDPSLLTDVELRFPGIEVVRLPVNHRSTPQVVDTGRHVLAVSAQPDQLSAARPDGSLITIVAHDDEAEESAWVARTIAAGDPSLVRSGQVAVLARTHAQLSTIRRALAAVGIDVRTIMHGPGSPIQPVLSRVARMTEVGRLRAWAHDTLEVEPGDGSDNHERTVAQAVIDFLRVEPTGDGAEFRVWVDTTDPFGSSTPGVELLTFHGAKGREWHTVHLIGCETSLVPHRSATTNAARAEEARLLYVAITRATDELTISWARRRSGYQRRITPLLDGYTSTAPPAVAPPSDLIGRRPDRATVLDRLVAWRAGVAKAGAMTPEQVCSDAILAMIADRPPADPDALDAVTGLGAITSRRLFPGIADAISR
jgi:DNA helicase II / ATP-dependent DNA helicase PcrA